ncbi:MAG: SDR family oxidoreductase [Janthinobacterium lividum]
MAEGAYVFITGLAAGRAGCRRAAAQGQRRRHSGRCGEPERPQPSLRCRQNPKGHLDVLFANAGVAEFAPLGAVTEAHFDHHFDINVKGTLFTVQKALPLLRDGSSVIVMAAIVASTGSENFSVYSATKAAIRSFARPWTADLKARKSRVNAISPGPIETPGLNGVAGTPEQAAQFKAHMASGVPLGRIGEADEIAKAVVFLAPDDSSYVTGIELFVDGGVAQV